MLRCQNFAKYCNVWYNAFVMLKLTPLFSGSRGNCTLIQTNNTNILLDVGYSYKKILLALEGKNLTPKDITAIVITHEHDDHICALPMWTKHAPNTQIYVPQPIVNCIATRSYSPYVEGISGSFVVGDIQIDVYQCSHDSQACCGYRFSCAGKSIASITDTGCFDEQTVQFLAPCKVVQLECNHDITMLQSGRYPYLLKRRIASPFGHLSNDQCASILQQLIGSNVKKVVLAHLSENNNTAELAFDTVNKMYQKNNIVEGRDIQLYVASQHTVGETID